MTHIAHRADLCICVVLPRSAMRVSDLIWSALRERSISVEVAVCVDQERDPEVWRIAQSAASADARVRTVAVDSAASHDEIVGAALASSISTYAVIADPTCTTAEGGFRALVDSMRSSGSDMAIGVPEILGRRRAPVINTVDGSHIPTRRVSIEDRPGLIRDASLSTKVVLSDLLRRALSRDRSLQVVPLSARLLLLAEGIDVHTRTVVFLQSVERDPAGPRGSNSWIASRVATRRTLATHGARVRESFSRSVLVDEVLPLVAGGAIEADADGTSDLVAFLAGDLSTRSLAQLPPRARWELALVALGHMSLAVALHRDGDRIQETDVPALDGDRLDAEGWACLGIGRSDVRRAFLDRFVCGLQASGSTVQPRARDIDVSVVVPTYNVEPYIDELLTSIRASAHVNLEILVVDDDSTDLTWSRVLEHQEADQRIRAIRSPGAGGGQARDAAIELARGEYLAFADGDDLVPPGAYAEMLATARRSNADVVSGNYFKFFTTSTWDAAGGFNHAYACRIEGVSLDEHPQLVRHRAVWNRLIRREHWRRSALPFPGVPRSNDIVAMTSALLGARSVAVTPLGTYVYRHRPGSGSMTSAAGSADYTVSYFAEEVTCAALVQQRGSAAVSREYWAMVLRSDALKNIATYLQRRSGDVAVDSRVAEQIAKLYARAPREDVESLSPENQAVWALASAGRFEDAAVMSAVSRSGDSLPISTVARSLMAAEAHSTSRLALNAIGLKYLIRRFIRSKEWTEREVRVLGEVLGKLRADNQTPLAAAPFTLEERFTRAAGRLSAGKIELAVSPPTRRIAARVDGGGRVVGKGVSWLAGDSVTRLVARRFGDRERVRVPLHHLVVDEIGAWDVVLSPDAFPAPGVWVMEVEYEDDWGMRRSPLRFEQVTRGFVSKRVRRISVTRSGNDRSLILVRSPLSQRLKRSAARWFASARPSA